MTEEYEKRFKVICEICGESYRVINDFHLKHHGITVDEYRIQFPEAPTSRIPCIECGEIIFDSTTVNRSYCDECKEEVRRRQNRENKRRKFREHHRNLSQRDLAILADHHYTGLGTSEPSTWLDEIEVNGEPRISGAVWLERERIRLGSKGNIRMRPEKVSG